MPKSDLKGSPSKESAMRDKKPDSTLYFKKGSHDACPESTSRHEHTVNRDWAGKASLARGMNERSAGSVNNRGHAMMQRWLGEDGRDGPYNNVGSFFSEGSKGQKKGQPH
ncbi:hypothetical protein ABVK25_002085 [Lepraria finkii]|uniref:Uncharacterized protein n=1 Tax=Lepraria finkii TaxID=1340010 RepID=A0ABR4BIQ8_9LECA